MNIKMDYRANDYLQRMKPSQHCFYFRVPKGLWLINICGKRSSSYLSTLLGESIDGEAVAEYWVSKRKSLVQKVLLMKI